MKPQIIIFTAFITLASAFFSNTAKAGGSSAENKKAVQKTVKLNPELTLEEKANASGQSIKPIKPGKPRQNRDNHEKDSTAPKEATHRRAHGDEDGKHHHFHMHRAKKSKRFPDLVCMCAKILLFIVHICLLAYVINAPFAH